VLLALAGSVVISVYHFVAPEALSANVSGSQAPSSASGPEDAQEVEEFFDDLIGEQLRDEHVAGATVAVVKDGQFVFAKGYGYADWEQGTPVTADHTLFYPGSAGKLFTWTAVMQLVEEGKLDLDADINTYLDFEIPDTHPEPVTMGNLLTHTAGFEEQFAAQLAEDREDVLPLREFLVRYMPERVYPAGEYFAYSNYGTALAGYIVERVSGEPYEQYIEEHILQPLKMESSAATQPLPTDLASQLSKGYHYEDGTYEAKDFEWISAAPAAPVRATAPDMAKFMLMHLESGEYGDARIMEESTALEMHRQQFTHDPRLSGVTYGFITSRENDQDIIWHDGESARFSTMVALLPEERTGLFVSYNTPFEPRETLSAFLDHYYPLQEETSPPEPPSDFPSRADRWAGSYIPTRVAFTGPQKIVGWLDPLQVSTSGNQNLLLQTPFGEQRYTEIESGLLKEENGERLLTFREDDQGQVTHLFWGPVAYFKAAPYQTLGFQLPLLAACTALFVSTLIVYPAVFFARRWRGSGAAPSRAARVARWLAGILSALNLSLLVWFVLSLLEFAETYVWPTETVSTITGLWLLSVPLTLSSVMLAVLAWKDRYWSVASRAHYTLVALAAVLFVWFLSNWNLIGL
jgi:CubicO group peptidase (beta-lactamase class C family)